MKLTEREPPETMTAEIDPALDRCYNGTKDADVEFAGREVYRAMHDASDDGGLLDALLEVVRDSDELMADVERRYPGEELHCPFMHKLADALAALRAHPKAKEILP